jgi:hypothetical protein
LVVSYAARCCWGMFYTSSLACSWVIPNTWEKKNSILKLPTKEWHDKSCHSQRPPSQPPKRRGSGHRAKAGHPD